VDRIADEKEERKLVILAAHRRGRREERVRHKMVPLFGLCPLNTSFSFYFIFLFTENLYISSF
jgi:hypothetical protein